MKKKLLGIIVLSTLSALSIGGCDKSQAELLASNAPIQITTEKVVEKNSLSLPNFASLVQQVGNTVVNITAEVPIQNPNGQIDPFFELFRQFGNPMPMPKMQPQIKTSMGSGFIISKDGYILTNSHVVEDAKKIVVKTVDKREFTAKLIGIDKKTDIALLKVNASDLPAVKIGDPNSLAVGEWVAAIGAPFGFDNSVTQGIVSAKGRSLPNDGYVPFIQTDVPINPGNSGGPLFNLNGEVVGINSQIYSRSGGYMGISFSIPIDIAINIANQLKQYGKVSHGQLGVQVQAVTQEIAKSFGLKNSQGALVAKVIDNSPAQKAGIKTGDIILEVNNKVVTDSATLPMMIGSKPAQEIVKLKIYRNQKYLVLSAKLSDSQLDLASNDNNDSSNNSNSLKIDKFGLAISELPIEQKKQLNIANGVVIADSQGIAQLAGIQTGDILLSVDNKPIHNITQAKKLMSDKNLVTLLISRNNQQMFVTISRN